MTEKQIQNALFRWANDEKTLRAYPELVLLHHIPNETKDPVDRKQKLQGGMKPGVPDVCLPVPRGTYHGLYIELKTPSGKPSDEQKWWHDQLVKQGYFALVVYGLDGAIDAIEWYLNCG